MQILYGKITDCLQTCIILAMTEQWLNRYGDYYTPLETWCCQASTFMFNRCRLFLLLRQKSCSCNILALVTREDVQEKVMSQTLTNKMATIKIHGNLNFVKKICHFLCNGNTFAVLFLKIAKTV